MEVPTLSMLCPIRERVQAIGVQMLAGDASPSEIRNYEVQLSGLLAATNKALTGAELAYKRKLASTRALVKTAAEARMQAEAGDEYADLVDAKATKDSVMELLRTCRSHQRSLSDEMRMQR